MSKKRDIFHKALVQFKAELGQAFRQMREERGLTLEQLQSKLRIRSLRQLERVEEGTSDLLFIYFRLCCFYGKRPQVSFVDLPEEENLYLQLEKSQCVTN